MSNYTSLFSWLLTLVISIHAQGQKSGVKLLCSPRQDSILLRWAPANSEVWRLGNQYGYQVKRYTLLKNKKMSKEMTETLLTPNPIKPAAIETWEKYSEDKYVAIAAECIFGSFYKDIPVAGNPHIAYKKHKEEMHRYSFALYTADQSVMTAKLSGLYFADKTAKPDEKYLYRVYINCPDSLATDTAYTFTGISEYLPLPKPLNLKAEWEDKKVSLSWNILYLKHIYNSYIVEKSEDGGKTYKALNDNAAVQLSDKEVTPEYMYKSDTLPDNQTVVYYRVRGVSTFGETGPASDSIFGHGILPITKAPVIVATEAIDNKKVKLYWDYPAEMNPYVSGFKIYHSVRPKGRKKIIFSGTNPEQRQFTDSIPGYSNYYMISVYNQQKEKLSSIHTYAELIDSFPPAPPVNLKGSIDSSGKVTILWQANTDKDIDSYRVYRANKEKYEFMLVTPSSIEDTVFTDSINLKTLTRKIHYKIRAIDTRLNQSEFSDILTLIRPDIIPPVAPLIKDITNLDSNPEITWINSSSDDVAYHHIYRKEKEDSLYQQIASLEKNEEVRSAYLDKQALAGKEYIYHIVAEDEAGLESPPSNLGYFKTPSGITESIKLKKRIQTDKVILFWNIKSAKTVSRILVYRAEEDGPLRLYGHSEGEKFTDEKINPESKYSYSIKAIYNDGSSSSMCRTILVKM